MACRRGGSAMIERRPPERMLSRRLLLSRIALAWEHFWPALWPMLCVAGFFVVAALFDLFSLLPGIAHAAFLLGLSLIHISEPTRLGMNTYAVFCLKQKNKYRSSQPQ